MIGVTSSSTATVEGIATNEPARPADGVSDRQS
jgi:hypothetical protein